MDEILQRLTEVSIRQEQMMEHLAARQGQTEQELDARPQRGVFCYPTPVYK